MEARVLGPELLSLLSEGKEQKEWFCTSDGVQDADASCCLWTMNLGQRLVGPTEASPLTGAA